MTEIQWLVDVMLNHKLPGPVKDKFIARIGEVEASLSRHGIVIPPAPRGLPIQSPSTQRLLDDMALTSGPAVIAAQEMPAVKRIQGGEVSTGAGTRGPRKF